MGSYIAHFPGRMSSKMAKTSTMHNAKFRTKIAQKTVGQIAYETYAKSLDIPAPRWSEFPIEERNRWERVAKAAAKASKLRVGMAQGRQLAGATIYE